MKISVLLMLCSSFVAAVDDTAVSEYHVDPELDPELGQHRDQ